MINAIGINSFSAADLTYPALVVEEYLRDSIGAHAFCSDVPTAALWAIQQFLADAASREATVVDPVVSAVSYQLADAAFRAAHHSQRVVSGGDDRVLPMLSRYIELLDNAVDTAQLDAEQVDTASSLAEFLATLRIRGQGETYARYGTCVST